MDENYKKPDVSSSNVVQPIHNNLLELVQPDCAKISKNQSSNANIVNKFRSQFFNVLDNETGEPEANYHGKGLKYN